MRASINELEVSGGHRRSELVVLPAGKASLLSSNVTVELYSESGG